eukprot:1001385-Prymnesium_polylepis.1
MESPDEEGEPYFRIDGVRCKEEKGSNRIRIGWQLPPQQREVEKKRKDEGRAAAVRRSKHLAVVKERLWRMVKRVTMSRRRLSRQTSGRRSQGRRLDCSRSCVRRQRLAPIPISFTLGVIAGSDTQSSCTSRGRMPSQRQNLQIML